MLGNAAPEQERERWTKIGEEDRRKGRQARGFAYVCLLFPLRFYSVSFTRAFRSRRGALFYGGTAREPPREKGWGDAGVERKTRHCLTKLRGIKFAFYCARFLNASSRRGRGKLPSAIVRGGNSPISFRDMNMTSPFDPPVGSHGESISRIKIHTRVWSFD